MRKQDMPKVLEVVAPFIVAPPTTISLSRVEKLTRELEEVKLKIRQLDSIRTNRDAFFAFENGRGMIADQIRQLQEKESDLEEKLGTEKLAVAGKELHIEMARRGYDQVMDPAAFSAVRKSGLPSLMVLRLSAQNNSFSIRIERRWNDVRVIFDPDLPKSIKEQYQKATGALERRLKKDLHHTTLQISAFYEGVMPSHAREKLKAAIASKQFDDFFIVIEAPAWRVDYWNSPVLAPGDPLIEGWVERTQQLYLIAAYDPTPFEQYLKEQFHFGTTVPD